MAEIHASLLSNKILSYNNYIYDVYVTKNGLDYWTCKVKKCPGRVTSVMRNGELKIDVIREHTHSTQPEQVVVLRLKSNLRKKAIEEAHVDPDELVRQELQKLSAEARNVIPRMQNLRQYVKDCRSSLHRNLIELLIPKSHLKTISGRQFLLHDNIINNEVDQTSQRTIIFATKDNLRWLFTSAIWYVDGTFGIEDPLFLQIWTILVKVNEVIVPLAYILMQTQHEEEYHGSIQTLQQKAAEYDILNQRPSIILANFDGGTINGVKSAVPKAHICMSLYHFKHALHSKIQVLRLHDGYTHPVKQWLWSAIGLAYVPPADVVEAFDILLKQLENDRLQLLIGLEDVANYLETNYIRGQPELSEPPLYPIEMWNIYERTLTNDVLTDSLVEEWYRKFEKTVNNYIHGSSLHSLVNGIRTEQDNTEAILTKITFGQKIDPQIVGKKKMNKIERIRECAGRYQEFKSAGAILAYMRTMGSYNALPIT